MKLISIIIFGSIFSSCQKEIPKFYLSKNTLEAIKILEPNLKNELFEGRIKKNTICELYDFVQFVDTSSIILKSKYSADIKLLVYADVQSYFSTKDSFNDHGCYLRLENLMASKKVYIFPKVTKNQKIFFHLKNGNWSYLRKKVLELGAFGWILGSFSITVFLIFIYRFKKWKRVQ